MTSQADDDRTRHIEDEVLRAVIDHYDDPDHPDALTMPKARELLATIQRTFEDRWDEYVRRIRVGDIVVVRDEASVVVLRDESRRVWEELLDATGRYDRVDRTIARVAHHQATARRLGREIEDADPLLVRKPHAANAGQRLTEAVINRLLGVGVPAEEAWAYYGVEVRGYSPEEWVERGGYDDRMRVADAVENARAHLGE